MFSYPWGLFHFKFTLKDRLDLGTCFPPICECEIDKADRGWFKRFHDNCKKERIYYGCPLGIDIFKLVMTFAVVCGVLWIAGAVTSFLAYWNIKENCTDPKKSEELKESGELAKAQAQAQALISTCLYSIGYIIFLGLFGAIMAQINTQNSGINNDLFLCEKVKRKFRRSGNEFIGYSICAFFLITLSIIFTSYSAFLLWLSGSSSARVTDPKRIIS